MPISLEILPGPVSLYCGDCLDVLATLPENSVDSCVTDPPYHLTSIVKRFGGEDAKAPKEYKTLPYGGNFKGSDAPGGGTGAAFARMSKGFMGKQWDGGDVAFRPETWAAVYRVLKPGGYLLAFGGTRTYHRMACAIEDAGFDVRDMVSWVFGSGFPKSHNVGDGWGTALKPALEPICVARKPLIGTVAANVLEHGTGAINIDGCRVESGGEHVREGVIRRTAPALADPRNDGRGSGGWSQDASFVATNHPGGRWPANVIHDGSDEVVAAFPDSAGQQGDLNSKNPRPTKTCFGDMAAPLPHAARNDFGSAARFFYSAKADADDRLGSKHPTVKPVDLMQYLVRLVTPKGGTVLDPFAGTGTTGEAAAYEGMHAILVEREAEYQEDIRRRMNLITAGPDERLHQSIKARGKTESPGPLFDRPSPAPPPQPAWHEMWQRPFDYEGLK